MSFLEELKRRNVIRVGIAYVLLGWVVLQLVVVQPEMLMRWSGPASPAT